MMTFTAWLEQKEQSDFHIWLEETADVVSNEVESIKDNVLQAAQELSKTDISAIKTAVQQIIQTTTDPRVILALWESTKASRIAKILIWLGEHVLHINPLVREAPEKWDKLTSAVQAVDAASNLIEKAAKVKEAATALLTFFLFLLKGSFLTGMMAKIVGAFGYYQQALYLGGAATAVWLMLIAWGNLKRWSIPQMVKALFIIMGKRLGMMSKKIGLIR